MYCCFASLRQTMAVSRIVTQCPKSLHQSAQRSMAESVAAAKTFHGRARSLQIFRNLLLRNAGTVDTRGPTCYNPTCYGYGPNDALDHPR